MALNKLLYIPMAEAGLQASLYAIVWSTTDPLQVFHIGNAEFESFADLNYDQYRHAIVEISSTGLYYFEIPAALLLDNSRYVVTIHRQVGASPAVGDTIVQSGVMQIASTSTESSVVIINN